ncbi:MAG: restriction endonuclease subunit S [Smithella sp.]
MSENQEIPNGWVIADLQDAVDVFDNLRKPINFDEREKRIAGKKENELYPYYGATGQVGWIDDFITDGEYVLVGEDGAPFLDFYKPKAYIIKGKTWVNNHAHILRFKEGLTTNAFILHFLNHFNYNGYVNGTTRLKLTKSRLAEIPFPIPPHPDQTRIVAKIEELFSSLDKGIESLKTAQQQLKVYRQAVLKWAFEGKLTKNTHGHFDKLSDHGTVTSGADYLPVATSTGSVTSPVAEPVEATDKEGDLPQGDALSLPKGWKIVELKEVCEIKRGKSKHRPRNEPSLFGGKYPFIQTGDIRNAKGGYIKKFSQTYSEIGLQQSKLWAKGTLCITIAANIGETAILDLDACFPDSVVGLVCNEKMLLNKYTNYFFISHKSKLEELAPATAQKNINVDILEKVKIPLPPLAEQQTIVAEIESRLSVCDKIEESIEQSLRESESLRQSILKKAFEGKLVPQVPSDLPAPRPGKWFVYVLECDDGSYYKGHTKDILERWKQHARGVGAEWTAKHPPRKLVHWEEFSSEHAAVEREKDLKTGFGRKWLEREIKAGRTRQAGEPAIVLLERIKAKKEKTMVNKRSIK